MYCPEHQGCYPGKLPYDMESTDIDRVLQTLPFSGHESLFDQPPLPKRPYRPRKNTKTKNS